MSCDRHELHLIERQDGTLDPADAAALAAHLAGCAGCRAFEAALPAVSAEALRGALPAREPGEAFFVRTRNEVWQALATTRAPATAPPASAGLFARLAAALLAGRRGLAAAAAVVVAVLTVALWPGTPTPLAPVAPTGTEAPQASLDEGPAEGEAVLAELGTLEPDELRALAGRVVLETHGDVRPAELEEDPDAVESQIESLSAEELRALDATIARATREAKGA